MRAVLTKPLRSGTKVVAGKVIRRGLGTITLSVIDSKKGTTNIKTFKESDYSVSVYDDREVDSNG